MASLTIQRASYQKFCNEIEKLCSNPPKWVSDLHVEIIRLAMNGIPEIFSEHVFAPQCNKENVTVEFRCTKNDYKLILKMEKDPYTIFQRWVN